MRITRADGLIDVEQAATLCGVSAITVRNWINRGYGPKNEDGERRRLPVAKRENGLIYLNPVEVAKADHATAERARRIVVRDAAFRAA